MVLTGLFKSLSFGQVWWSLKYLNFQQFPLWAGVCMVLEELNLTVSILGGCGDLERTDF